MPNCSTAFRTSTCSAAAAAPITGMWRRSRTHVAAQYLALSYVRQYKPPNRPHTRGTGIEWAAARGKAGRLSDVVAVDAVEPGGIAEQLARVGKSRIAPERNPIRAGLGIVGGGHVVIDFAHSSSDKKLQSGRFTRRKRAR